MEIVTKDIDIIAIISQISRSTYVNLLDIIICLVR